VGVRRRQGTLTWSAAAAALLVFVVVAVAGVAAAGSPAPSAARLPAPLRIDTPRLDKRLEHARGTVGVQVTLRARPVLAAVARGPKRAAIDSRLSARDRRAVASASSGRELARRKALARARALHSLKPEARRAQLLALPLERAVKRAGGSITSFDPATSTVTARVPARALRALSRRRDVASVAPVPVRRPAAFSDFVAGTGAPSFWAAGHTGGQGTNDSVPATLWIDDQPIELNHPDFHGVNWQTLPGASSAQACGSPSSDPGGNCDHGTQVASLVVGQGIDGARCPSGLTCVAADAQQKGVAYGISHAIATQVGAPVPSDCSWGIFGFAVGVTQTGGTSCPTPLAGANWPAQVRNQSYASNNPSAVDLSADAADAAYGVLAVAGAGNEGPGAGTVAAPCVGYDALCVGSYEMGSNLGDPADDTISSFSARGPGPLGVKKPDLVASGDDVVAEEYYLAHNRLWTSATGTSFAAPLVSGGAALLVGAGVTDHLAVKSILINSARPGRATSGSAIGTQTTWNPDWGWGELNLQTALAQRSNFVTGSVPGGSARFYSATVGAGDRATLTWDMRVTGYCNVASCGDPTAVTHSLTNLDLVQRDASSSNMQTSSTSTVDSVEQVRSPGAGQAVYVVRAASSVDGASAEPFALAAANSLTEIKAPEPTMAALVSTTRARQGEPITVTAHLQNPSDALDGQNAQATLVLPAGVELVSGTATQDLGTLAKSATATVTWTVAGNADGLGDLQVVATTQAYGETLRSQADAGSVRIDSTAPSISLSAPSGEWNDPNLAVSWSGDDAGSGVDHFDVEVAPDGGAFAPWLEPTTDTAGTYSGSYGHSYVFRARAVDALGNASEWVSSQPVAVVDPSAPPGSSGGTVEGGTGDTTTTTWTPAPTTGGGTQTGGTSGTTTTTTRKSAGLKLTYAKIVGRYVVLRGRLRTAGRIVAQAKLAGHSLRSSTTARARRFAVRLRLRSKPPRRGIAVRISFAGDAHYTRASIKRRVT
jgi:uncharacterized repeat protein (TIGR01451 family)